MNSPSYQFSRRLVAELDCGIVHPVDQSTPIESMAIFCHGYGAGGDDLVGLAQEILQIAAPTAGTMLVFPAAPLSLEDEGMPGGRAWWHLSIQRLLSAIEDGQYELVRSEVPDGIDEARIKLTATVQQLLEENRLKESNLLLGGFSQGAMLSMDVATRGLENPPAAMTLFSGCLICERQWKPGVARLSSTKIFQSHGRLDPILPLQTGKWLTDLLSENGCEVDFKEFNGVHTIPMESIEKSAHLLAQLTEASS
ncbi:MAG: lysophospholipase [Planctomycetota bacterium]|nr:lysophospholipase [Planctomycetota bacterium]